MTANNALQKRHVATGQKEIRGKRICQNKLFTQVSKTSKQSVNKQKHTNN